MISELPDDAQRWTAAERELALQVLDGRTVVVNVRRGGPHRHLVLWLVDRGMISYVGHAGSRHSWPQSDFANPFMKQARVDRKAQDTSCMGVPHLFLFWQIGSFRADK